MEFLMEFGLRDWLLVLGPVFIIGILLHGYWRMRSRRNSLKMSLDKSFLNSRHDSGADDLSFIRAELPNGGARVVTVPRQASLNLEEDVPVLMEPVDIASPAVEQGMPPITATQAIDEPTVTLSAGSPPPISAVPEPEETPAVQGPRPECPEKFIVLYVSAKRADFDGGALLQRLQSQDMTHGEMSIFHRLDERGESTFSLVNAVEPGTFDLATMANIKTPAVSLFMRAHELQNPIGTYHQMLSVAQSLASSLDGEVRDQKRQPLTRKTMEQHQQELETFVATFFY